MTPNGSPSVLVLGLGGRDDDEMKSDGIYHDQLSPTPKDTRQRVQSMTTIIIGGRGHVMRRDYSH
jgi:hypothetical protein